MPSVALLVAAPVLLAGRATAFHTHEVPLKGLAPPATTGKNSTLANASDGAIVLDDRREALGGMDGTKPSPLAMPARAAAIPDVSGISKGLHGKESFHALVKAFLIVSVAELFDKTWFMSLILALKYGWRVAFTGGSAGLILHCVLSAALGYGFARLLKPSVLDFITAGLFFFFTLLYAKDAYYAEPDSDLIASGKEEASEALPDESPDVKDEQRATKSSLRDVWQKSALLQSFMAVFIAEWGDRTQMAMISLHSSLPLFPVFLGSAAAFLMLTASAVAMASLVAKCSLSERVVMVVASVSFLIFGVLALKDGIQAKAHHD